MKNRVGFLLAGCALVFFSMLLMHAQSNSSTPPAGKTSEETFKNIQILKGIPADELLPAMRFIAASLGVGCDHCHVPGAFDKDDKKDKQTARKMMQMTNALNKDNFEGHLDVTCYSCHHGEHHPAGTPTLMSGPKTPENKPPAGAPTVEQILDKYVQALGGKSAIEKLDSFSASGNVGINNRQLPVEIFAQAPAKRTAVVHLSNGDIVSVFDGQAGWQANPGQPVHDLPGSELDGAKLDADLYLPIHLQQTFNNLKLEGIEKVGDNDAYAVAGRREGKAPVTFYFDPQSGLLVRQLRYVETVLGRIPTQTDFADYRPAGDVKMAYRWTTAQPGRTVTTQLDKIQVNMPVDEKKFAKPAEKASAPTPAKQ